MWLNVLLFFCAFIAMESVAWMAHKYLMHGFLWNLHKDHHRKVHPHQVVERNDSFFVIFALPAIALLYAGTILSVPYCTALGTGIVAYGLCYFIVHDVFIHQRIKWLRNADSIYFRAIRRAHKMHHKHLEKEEGECFGMLWVPWKYFKAEIEKSK